MYDDLKLVMDYIEFEYEKVGQLLLSDQFDEVDNIETDLTEYIDERSNEIATKFKVELNIITNVFFGTAIILKEKAFYGAAKNKIK